MEEPLVFDDSLELGKDRKTGVKNDSQIFHQRTRKDGTPSTKVRKTT
jgi:hypothetical protein